MIARHLLQLIAGLDYGNVVFVFGGVSVNEIVTKPNIYAVFFIILK